MKPHILHAEKVKHEIEVYNWPTGKSYRTSEDSPFVITGTKGERWVVSTDELMSGYTLLDGTPITESSISWQMYISPILLGDIFYAHHVDLKYHPTIKTPLGNMVANASGIPHANGDFIVHPLDERGLPSPNAYLVNGFIFYDIYKDIGDMRTRILLPFPSHYLQLMYPHQYDVAEDTNEEMHEYINFASAI